jgi:hypothetical protein
LVQKGYLEECTPLYGQYKIGIKVDVKNLHAMEARYNATRQRQYDDDDGDDDDDDDDGGGGDDRSNSGFTADADRSSTTRADSSSTLGADVLQTAPMYPSNIRFYMHKRIVNRLQDEERKALRRRRPGMKKKKWITIDVIQTANEFKGSPSQLLYAMRELVENNVTQTGGQTSVYNRYRVLQPLRSLLSSNVRGMDEEKSREMHIQTLTDLLHTHCLENQRRALSRADEIVSVMRLAGSEGDTSKTMGHNLALQKAIAAYFDEGSAIFDGDESVVVTEPIKNAKPDMGSLFDASRKEIDEDMTLPFDEFGWTQILDAVRAGRHFSNHSYLTLMNLFAMIRML